jgi:acetate kinase
VLTFLADKERLSASKLSDVMNKKSGVLGISGLSSDMREIEAAVFAGHPRAKLAIDMYNYRIKKFVGSYAAAMGGLDILVFTGGVGENQWATRAAVCKNMEFMGIHFDVQKNEGCRGKEIILSTPESKVVVIVVPTDEEMMIAIDTEAILKN